MTKIMTRAKKTNKDDMLTRACHLRAATANDENRSIQAVIATDEPVEVWDWSRGRISEILLIDGARHPDQVPLLDSHSRYSVNDVLGSTRDFEKENGKPNKLIARNYYAADGDSQKAWEKARDGHLTDNSIGYRIHNSTILDPGQSTTINGRKFTAPPKQSLRIVTDWEIFENSICPIGADAHAKNRGKQEFKEFNMKLTEAQRSHIVAKGFDNPDELTDAQQRSLLADFDAADDSKNGKRSADFDEITRDAQAREAGRKAEQERQANIRKLATDQIPAEMVQRCIDDGLSVDEARGQFYRHLTTVQPIIGSPNISNPGHDVTARHMEAALLMRSGIDDKFITEQYSEQIADQADKMRTMSMIELAGRCLALENRTIPTGRDELIRSALSTASLSSVLGNIANKAALRSYKSANNTWQQWCSIGSVSDFKEHTRVRLTDVGEFEEIKANGEIPHGSLSDHKETLSIDTYGKQLSISRKDWYNDDLGLFLKISAALGRKAANKIASLVYAHLVANPTMGDGTALFAAGHSNLSTSSALAAAGLAKALLALRKQTDKDGDAINIAPKFMLIPPDLEGTARTLLESDIMIATGVGSSAATTPNKNIYKGIVTPIVENRLSANSTTAWYLIGDPADVDTIEVAFLNGKQTPTIEKTSHDFDTLGMRFRGYLDAGVKALDWRGMVKCTA